MPERFEIYTVYKRRYINTLPFLSFPRGGKWRRLGRVAADGGRAPSPENFSIFGLKKASFGAFWD